jgi:eukaryotic-like serine/threonine-protein kinase
VAIQSNAATREQELFCECLHRDPQERAAWLQRECGPDAPLLRRLELLLAAHEEAERLCVDDLAFTGTIDGYHILRVIGEGGMGVVYEAMQEEPLRRRVAIKAIRPGMDTSQVLSRFHLERQALATMEHPHIARVFDAGNTPSGRPYFVMEFVDGKPLLRHCEERSLSLRQRLELFISVCQAVQHAHHKGVIHRDLKPGNILVTSSDEGSAPRIIDFGIARAVSPDFGADLTLPSQDMRPGTPAYMSPEQAGYSGLDVDTRSDIYSLGVILYELITGRLPVEPEEMGRFEFLRRLSSADLDVLAPSVQARRRPAAAPFRARDLSRDLDAIVLKALEPNRERRYPTALALAQDLRRYLDGLPVSALPPTLAYRTRRYWQRRRAHAIAAVIVVCALLTGIGSGAYGLIQARRAEAEARQEAASSKYVSEFLSRLFTLSDPNRTPGSPVTVQQVLEEGTRRVQKEMIGMPAAQAALLSTLAHVHDSIGSYKPAYELAQQSLAIRGWADTADTIEALLTLGRSAHRLGQFDQARAALSRAIELRSRSGDQASLEVASALNLLGGVEGQLERFAEAEAAHRRALAIQQQIKGADHIATYNSWRGLGIIYGRQGRHPDALQCFERILPIARRQYGPEHTIVADALTNIANELLDLGRYSEAETTYLQTLQMQRKRLGPDHPDLAFTLAGLGHVYRKQSLYKEAEPHFRAALRLREAALGPDNVRTHQLRKSLGLVRIGAGAVDEGYALLRSAIAGMERKYSGKHTDVLAAHRDAGIALVQARRYSQALPHLERVTGPETPARLRIDLNDSSFDGLRRSRLTGSRTGLPDGARP